MVEVDRITRAIAAHAKWKFHLKEAIASGKSEKTVAEVAPEDRCEFGHWLLALPNADRQSAEWQKVRTLHADFHRAAANVLKLALAGKEDEATAEMAFGGNFAKVSSQLTIAMTDWKRSIAPDL